MIVVSKTKKNMFILVLLTVIWCLAVQAVAEKTNDTLTPEVLSLQQFVKHACEKDTVFQEILIAELAIKYNKILKLPSRDIILAARGLYNVNMGGDATSGPEASVSLDKLFPETGTAIHTEFALSPAQYSTKNMLAFNAYISQPIARNAFGSETRLLKKIVGIEDDILRYQIAEAYEDYLASLIALYYQWYSDYQNLKTAESALTQNKTLYSNTLYRYNSRIAYKSDVDRVSLQMLEKQENVITLTNKYRTTGELVCQAIRCPDQEKYVPGYSSYGKDKKTDFAKDYARFKITGRTYAVLQLMERKGDLEVRRNAEALLPSLNLLLGYSYEVMPFSSSTYNRKMGYAGVQLDFPFGRLQEKARHAMAKISAKQTRLSVQNMKIKLESDLKKLYGEMKVEERLVSLYAQKVKLAQALIYDEQRKYRQARTTLKDLIESIDNYDSYRYQLVLHKVKRSILTVEWFRLTDRLVIGNHISTQK